MQSGMNGFIKKAGNLKGINTFDATVTPEDIFLGKTAYKRGVKIIGTNPNINTSDATATAADIEDGFIAYGGGQSLLGTNTKKRYARGSFTSIVQANAGNNYLLTYTISGLSFKPSFLRAYEVYPTIYGGFIYADSIYFITEGSGGGGIYYSGSGTYPNSGSISGSSSFSQIDTGTFRHTLMLYINAGTGYWPSGGGFFDWFALE